MAEHRTPNPAVGGSSPSRPVRKKKDSMLKKLKTYVMNVIGEMKKVSWPTRSELVNSTIVVIVISAIAALLVGILDFIFATSLSMVLRSR